MEVHAANSTRLLPLPQHQHTSSCEPALANAFTQKLPPVVIPPDQPLSHCAGTDMVSCTTLSSPPTLATDAIEAYYALCLGSIQMHTSDPMDHARREPGRRFETFSRTGVYRVIDGEYERSERSLNPQLPSLLPNASCPIRSSPFVIGRYPKPRRIKRPPLETRLFEPAQTRQASMLKAFVKGEPFMLPLPLSFHADPQAILATVGGACSEIEERVTLFRPGRSSSKAMEVILGTRKSWIVRARARATRSPEETLRNVHPDRETSAIETSARPSTTTKPYGESPAPKETRQQSRGVLSA
ncbi:hypothetical protein BKA70DRAFT_607678 [Coprinopsis sp. MPI-PUGE-AT-0042]|nr:hypothetical protein BKA70DRAFT_607678 [Coprinopsis sp. MPI-PUGE-AT-0042]